MDIIMEQFNINNGIPRDTQFVTATTNPLTGVVEFSPGFTYRPKKLAVLTNIYGGDKISERVNTWNSNTVPAVTHGNAVPSNPWGILTGSKVGTSGNTQTNQTLIADTAWYVYSFFAYVPPGVTGAKINSALLGFSTGNYLTFSYDWDAPLTASTGVYGLAGVGASFAPVVDDFGNGFRRFHIIVKNTNKTTFIDHFDGSAAANKVILTGFQLIRVPDDGTSTRINDYVPVGVKASPFTGYGRQGGLVQHVSRFPFRDVTVFSDSIWGAAAGSWRMFDSVLEYFGNGSINSYGGYSTAQICAQFDAQNVGGAFDKSLVIFNCGRNDGLLTQATRDASLATLDACVKSLGHTHYKVCGVLLRFTCTASPGGEETTATNAATYAEITTYNAMLLAKYGDKFIDVQAISVASYDPTSAADVAAVAIGMRPPSLAPITGDGLHPGIPETFVLGSAVVESIKNEYGVL